VGEIAGPASSGRTALAFGLLATVTGREETVALVDAVDAFDPASAAGAGVDLARTLWVRAPALSEGLRATEILLRAGGFALVALDLAQRLERAPAPHHWLRLVRAAAATRTALVVLSDDTRQVGSHADLALQMRRLQPRFEGSPALLTGLEAEVAVVRHRRGPEGSVRLHFRSAP
jgi:RecA/RadA recombinase